MARPDEKDFLAKVKNIINWKKAKMTNPNIDRDKVYNETVWKKAAVAWAGSSVNLPAWYQKNVTNEIIKDQVKAQYPTANEEAGLSPANRAKHDEDIDTLIEALSMFIPASVIERWWMKLIWKLIWKLWQKSFKPQLVDEAIEWITNKWFRPEIWHSHPRRPYTMERPIQTLEEKANGEMWVAALNEDVDEYEMAKATMDKYNKIKDSMTPAYQKKYPRKYWKELSDENEQFLIDEMRARDIQDEKDIIKRLKWDRRWEWLNYPDNEWF